MEKLNMNSRFFFINDTVNLFPSLEYNSESIPIGNSIDFCISASWAPKESKKIFIYFNIKMNNIKNNKKIKFFIKQIRRIQLRNNETSKKFYTML